MMRDPETIGIVILAAGLGTRMKSGMAKVLHPLLGKPMILHVVEVAVRVVAGGNVVVVVGHQREKVQQVVSGVYPVRFAIQEEQLGTGHAVMCAMPCLTREIRDVVLLCGDVPLLRPETIEGLVEDHRSMERDLSLLAVDLENPFGYGRIILDEDKNLARVVEQSDATEEERNVHVVNTGIYCVNRESLDRWLPRIRPDNVKKEVYLTDIVGIAYRERKKTGILVIEDSGQTMGINTPGQLDAAKEILQRRKLKNS